MLEPPQRELNNLLARRPDISVLVITYNQEQYIRDALDSIFLQDHDLDIEILVGNDASTDQTTEVLNEVLQKSDQELIIINRSRNLGPSGNLFDLIQRCKGKYIAFLEGDDYWTDPKKLQKQYTLLNQNNELIACTHRYAVVDRSKTVIEAEYSGAGRPTPGLYKLKDFEEYRYFGHLGTLMAENIFHSNSQEFSIIKEADWFIADISLCLVLVLSGKIFIMEDNMLATRMIVEKNGSNYKSLFKKNNQIKNRNIYLEKLVKYAKDYRGVELNLKDRVNEQAIYSIIYFLRSPRKINYDLLMYSLRRLNSISEFTVYIMLNIPKATKILLKYLKKKIFC